MGFKEDEQFLRFLTMGAGGSAAVARHLSNQHGHRMVELERYTMANKLWATKIKRLRMPDLMCLDCGLRVEARAKSKLEIKMSDNEVPGSDRAWDAGLRDSDLVAFVWWDAERQEAAERAECLTVGAMRQAVSHSGAGGRKAASEGSELDRKWPARVPKYDGRVIEVEERRVKAERSTGGRQTHWLPDGVPAFIYVAEGEEFSAHERFLLGVVEPPADLGCPGATWDYAADLAASDKTAQYAAIKAAGIRKDESAAGALEAIAFEAKDWRTRLEANASLARIDPAIYTVRIAEAATEDVENRAQAIEATFVLSELGTNDAADLLSDLASDQSLDSELRSAAVWGLGAAGVNRPDLLLPFVSDADDQIALHAVAAYGQTSDVGLIEDVVALLSEPGRAAPSAAAILARQGAAGVPALLQATADADKRTWALVALGRIPEEVVRGMASSDLQNDLEAALRSMWAYESSEWLAPGEGEQELRFMQRQVIRHKPPTDQ